MHPPLTIYQDPPQKQYPIVNTQNSTYKLHHRSDLRTLLFLVPRDTLTAQQSSFLGRVPVELDWTVLRHVSALRQDPEGFQDTHGAGTIVICSGGRQKWEEIVGGVLMRTDDSLWGRSIADRWFKPSDDR